MSPLARYVCQGLASRGQRGLFPKGAFWTSLQSVFTGSGEYVHGCAVQEGASSTKSGVCCQQPRADSVLKIAALTGWRILLLPELQGEDWEEGERFTRLHLFTPTAAFGVWSSQFDLIFNSLIFVY